MDEQLAQQLYDKIDDMEDENTTLREVRDELMEENEKLREKNKELKLKLEYKLSEKGGELIGN